MELFLSTPAGGKHTILPLGKLYSVANTPLWREAQHKMLCTANQYSGLKIHGA